MPSATATITATPIYTVTSAQYNAGCQTHLSSGSASFYQIGDIYFAIYLTVWRIPR